MALAHNVFFSLHDSSEASRARLMQACRTHLTNHPGILFFACGVLADDLRREVNDLGFDVGLHIVFTDKRAHDAYQEAPAHLRFIAENKDGWKAVRVFDSVVEQSPATA
jgi:Stress responsive A/B Barrel Domain